MDERSAGFVIYCLRDGKPAYLLLRGSGNRYWGLPKGKVDPGETDEQAAARELEEETGIRTFEIEEGFERTITYRFRKAGKEIHKEVRYFLARVSSAEVRLSCEHSDYGWFIIEQIEKKIVFDNLRRAVIESDRFITQK